MGPCRRQHGTVHRSIPIDAEATDHDDDENKRIPCLTSGYARMRCASCLPSGGWNASSIPLRMTYPCLRQLRSTFVGDRITAFLQRSGTLPPGRHTSTASSCVLCVVPHTRSVVGTATGTLPRALRTRSTNAASVVRPRDNRQHVTQPMPINTDDESDDGRRGLGPYPQQSRRRVHVEAIRMHDRPPTA
jgi:hypothetical protein